MSLSRKIKVIPPTPRDQIIAGARRLYLSSGFRAVTMDELAAELGMSKKTIYQHFSSKEEVLGAVLENKFSAIHRDLEQVLAHGDRPMPVQLKELLMRMQGHISEIQPAFIRDVHRSDPSLFLHIDEMRQAVIRKYFGALLEKGRREGAVRGDIPVEMLMEILITSASSIVTPARLGRLNTGPQQAFQQVLDVFLNGILTGKD